MIAKTLLPFLTVLWAIHLSLTLNWKNTRACILAELEQQLEISVLILHISLLTPLISFWPKGLANFSLFLLGGEVDYGVNCFSGTNLFSHKEYAPSPVSLSIAGINNSTHRLRPLSIQPSTLKLFSLSRLRSCCLFALGLFLLPSFALPLLLSHVWKCNTKIQYRLLCDCIFDWKQFNFCLQGSSYSKIFLGLLLLQLSLNQRKTNGNYLIFRRMACLIPARDFQNKSSPLEKTDNKWSHVFVGISWKLMCPQKYIHSGVSSDFGLIVTKITDKCLEVEGIRTHHFCSPGRRELSSELDPGTLSWECLTPDSLFLCWFQLG